MYLGLILVRNHVESYSLLPFRFCIVLEKTIQLYELRLIFEVSVRAHCRRAFSATKAMILPALFIFQEIYLLSKLCKGKL